MYADFDYYAQEYAGKLIEEDEFKKYAKKASSRMDAITGNKLQFAFPENEEDVEKVKDCMCEVAEFLKKLQNYEDMSVQGMGYQTNAEGQLQGKVIKSVSSGSESVSYSATESVQTALSDAARSKDEAKKQIFEIVQDNLSTVQDYNGVYLLYAGDYPGRRCRWE